MIKPNGFDDGYQEFNGKGLPEGFSKIKIQKPRRPRKRKVPAWVANKKHFRKLILQQAELDLLVADLYWRQGLTAKEIAGRVLKNAKKFRAIESIVYRLRNTEFGVFLE